MHTPLVYNAHMESMARVWICDQCKHVWLMGDAIPTHCSKCRSRRWNEVSSNHMIDLAKRVLPAGLIPCADPMNITKAEVMGEVERRYGRPAHDPASCRLYRCGQCAALNPTKQ